MSSESSVAQKKLDICYYCGKPIMGLRFKADAINNGEYVCFRCKSKISNR
jgi:hypothetical protein